MSEYTNGLVSSRPDWKLIYIAENKIERSLFYFEIVLAFSVYFKTLMATGNQCFVKKLHEK